MKHDKSARGNSSQFFVAGELWLSTPGKKGQAHKDNTVRTVHLPPRNRFPDGISNAIENDGI